MKDYEEKYNEALERAREIFNSEFKPDDAIVLTKYLPMIFPELIEDKDEKIRKAILELVRQSSEILGAKNQNNMITWLENQYDPSLSKEAWCEMAALDMASWLKREVDDAYLQGICDAKNEIEKQGKQTPADKVEPKFHEGDWIISNNKKSIYQVIEVKRGIYVIRDNVDNRVYHIGIEECEKSGRLWSIDDAKDGDVLATSAGAFIYDSKNEGDSRPGYYCGINSLGRFQISSGKKWTNKEVYPATKKQRDLLFAKMHDAGYAWDNEKKELKKIESKTLDANKVIEWLKTKVYDDSTYGMAMIEQFKKDFEI